MLKRQNLDGVTYRIASAVKFDCLSCLLPKSTLPTDSGHPSRDSRWIESVCIPKVAYRKELNQSFGLSVYRIVVTYHIYDHTEDRTDAA